MTRTKMVTIGEAAKHFGVCKTSIRNWCKAFGIKRVIVPVNKRKSHHELALNALRRARKKAGYAIPSPPASRDSVTANERT